MDNKKSWINATEIYIVLLAGAVIVIVNRVFVPGLSDILGIDSRLIKILVIIVTWLLINALVKNLIKAWRTRKKSN